MTTEDKIANNGGRLGPALLEYIPTINHMRPRISAVYLLLYSSHALFFFFFLICNGRTRIECCPSVLLTVVSHLCTFEILSANTVYDV